MQRKILTTLLGGILIAGVMVLPSLSYADWSVGIGIGDDHHDHWAHHDGYYGWHDHPHWGYRYHYLPDGYFSLWVGGLRYYYYDGLYYSYVGGDYVVVAPPVGAVVSTIPSDFQPVVVNGMTYYVSSGTYYIYTPHGYRVVSAPMAVIQPPMVQTTVTVTQPAPVPAVPEGSFVVNVPNSSGGYTPVTIIRSGAGFVGPQGEFYPDFPKVSQLRAMYGK